MLGLGIALYPLASNYLLGQGTEDAVARYERFAGDAQQADQRTRAQNATIRYNKLLMETSTDNSSLLENLPSADGASGTPTEEMAQALNEYLAVAQDEGNVIATVDIPSIKVSLPIYYGASTENLTKGAALLKGTSLVGGDIGAHSVITAHTGLLSSKLFTDLDKMALGDLFTLSTINGTRTYQVDQILVVEPSDISALGIDPAHDYVTLVTCTPYGENTHRLLVRGTRVSAENFDAQTPPSSTTQSTSVPPERWQSEYFRAALLGLGLAVLWIIVLLLDRRKRKKKEDEDEDAGEP